MGIIPLMNRVDVLNEGIENQIFLTMLLLILDRRRSEQATIGGQPLHDPKCNGYLPFTFVRGRQWDPRRCIRNHHKLVELHDHPNFQIPFNTANAIPVLRAGYLYNHGTSSRRRMLALAARHVVFTVHSIELYLSDDLLHRKHPWPVMGHTRRTHLAAEG